MSSPSPLLSMYLTLAMLTISLRAPASMVAAVNFLNCALASRARLPSRSRTVTSFSVRSMMFIRIPFLTHSIAACSRAKRRLANSPGLLLLDAVLLILLLLTFDLSLGSFLLIQPDGFDNGIPGQRIQPFRIHDHSKSRLIRGLEEVERVLRIFP